MISARKTNAIIKMKTKMISKNNTILFAPIMAIGFAFLYKSIFSGGEGDKALVAKTMVLQLGLLFNILMSGLMATCMPLAEEKEKNTLRVLMTSSVNGLEFIIGSLVPVLILTEVVNILMLPISDNMGINIPVYIIVTTLATFTTMILGMIIGIITKNQMSASLAITPILLVLMMVPLFASLSSFFSKISIYIYTGTLNEIINNLVFKKPNLVPMNFILIMLGWLVVSIVAFQAFYKSNGLDND